MKRSIVCLLVALLLVSTCAILTVGDPYSLMLFGQGNYKSRPAVYGGPIFWDVDFAQKLFQEIPTYKNMSFMIDECFAGGFLDDLAFVNGMMYPGPERNNLSIACASRWDRYSVFEAPLVPGPSSIFLQSYFSVGWLRGINAPHPSNDGFKDAFGEAADWLNSHTVGKLPSYPQYHSDGPLAMDTLTLAKQSGDDKRYAIIFGAGSDEAHYNSAEGVYDALKSDYGYTDNDIALLWCDGNYRFKGSNGTGSTWSNIDYSATKANLWKVLEDMGASGGTFDKVGSNDRLLVCFVGHGGTGAGNSSTVITSTLENFEVKNLTGETANDFHVVITGVQPSDIASYYKWGWGNGVATSLSAVNGQPRTDVTWTGSVNHGDWVHFGITWKGSALATNYEASWTKNGMQLASLDISKAPTWWQPQADFETRALIVNLFDQPLALTEIDWAIIDGHIDLESLMWDFEPPGGWIPYEPGYSPVLEPMSNEDPNVGQLELRFDGRPYARSGAYSIVLRYGVESDGSEQGMWRNTVACHVEPVISDARAVSQIAENVYAKLVDWSPEGYLVPQLLRSWEVSEEANVWWLQLREGVYFHDMSPVIAEYVAMNLDRDVELLPGLIRPALIDSGIIDEIQVIDDYTLEIRFTRPYPDFMTTMAGMEGMVAGPATLYGEGVFVGAGPFWIRDWSDEWFDLEAFSDYWNPQSEVQELSFVIVPDEAMRHAMMLSGEIDILVGYDPVMYWEYEFDPEFVVCGDFNVYLVARADVYDFPCFPDLAMRLEYVYSRSYLRIGIPEI